MAQVKLYNQKGEAIGNLELNKDIFEVAAKQSVVHQVYNALMANAREPWADTKGKGEVRGGGKKPWKQKGTGRARHGSIRSPIWKGGGVIFGPKTERNYKQKINKKMNQLAVEMCLSDKVKNEKFVVLEDFAPTGKTKEMFILRKALPGAGRKTLWLLPEKNVKTKQSLRGLATVDIGQAKDLNVIDLLKHQYIIVTKKGVEILEKRLSKPQLKIEN